MNLLSITLRSFKSYGPEPQIIDLTNVDAVGIGGRNGSGKSSIIEALTFALYGKAVATETRELGDDALINDRAPEAYVSVTFEKDGNPYTVERTISRRGSGKAQLESPILVKRVADVRAVNEKVESLLGMNYDTFISSTIIRQDEMDRLTAKRPAERKEVLANIFGLQAYEIMREKAHEKGWEIREEIATLEQGKKSLEEKIEGEEDIHRQLVFCEIKIVSLQEELKMVEAKKKDVETKLEEIRQKKSVYDGKVAEREGLLKQLEQSEENVESIRTQLEQAKKAEDELEALRPRLIQREKLDFEYSNLIQQRGDLKVKIAEQQQNIENIKRKIREEQENQLKIRDYTIPECPICKRPLDEPHRKQLLEEYEKRINELLKDCDGFIKEVQKMVNILNKQVVPKIQKTERELEELKALDKKIGGLTTTSSRLSQLQEDITKSSLRTTQIRCQINGLVGSIKELMPIIQSYASLDADRRKIDRDLVNAQKELATTIRDQDHANEDLKEIEEAKNKHKDLMKQVGDKGKVRLAYEFLEKEVFHKDGIPTALLMEIVPEIETEASKMLRELSNGRMDINFKFGRKTRIGKMTEELIVEAVDQGVPHPVSRYSGGERMRINLALRLGVSEVIAKRSGYKGKIETLIIDEGFGSLDEEGRRAAVEILQALRQRFKKILVISHIDDVREAFETKFLVTKPVGGFSTISIL